MSVRPSIGVVIVASGGAAGALARWGVGTVIAAPGGTLVVNVVGSFLLGAITARRLPSAVRLLAATGFCASFTTYSTFAVETLSLGTVWGPVYLVVTYATGVTAAVIGGRVPESRVRREAT